MFYRILNISLCWTTHLLCESIETVRPCSKLCWKSPNRNYSNKCLINSPSFNMHILDVLKLCTWCRLILSWRRQLPYRNQSIDLLCKSMDWFLYDNGLRHERVKYVLLKEELWNDNVEICMTYSRHLFS